MTFQLDTTGTVHILGDDQALSNVWHWDDLSPFTQGYIEALLASEWSDLAEARGSDLELDGSLTTPSFGFSDLAPETLARIIADCGGMVALLRAHLTLTGPSVNAGRKAWKDRQSDWPAMPLMRKPFPPRTVQLGDDGKVRFT